jgi:hypothetical protein
VLAEIKRKAAPLSEQRAARADRIAEGCAARSEGPRAVALRSFEFSKKTSCRQSLPRRKPGLPTRR